MSAVVGSACPSSSNDGTACSYGLAAGSTADDWHDSA